MRREHQEYVVGPRVRGSGDGDALLLPPGHINAALPQLRLIPRCVTMAHRILEMDIHMSSIHVTNRHNSTISTWNVNVIHNVKYQVTNRDSHLLELRLDNVVK